MSYLVLISVEIKTLVYLNCPFKYKLFTRECRKEERSPVDSIHDRAWQNKIILSQRWLDLTQDL